MKRFLLIAALAASAAAPAFPQETTVAPQPAGPVVTLQTTMGEIQITLDRAGAPITSDHFRRLVEKKYFNGAAVYRIEPGFVVQLGDLDAKLQYREPPLPPIPLETATNHHTRGAVALAHADDPDSGHGTFYFDLSENSGLDATQGAPPNTTGYAVFGQVTAGMDVVDAIAAVELASDGGPFPGKLPKEPVVVTRAFINTEE